MLHPPKYRAIGNVIEPDIQGRQVKHDQQGAPDQKNLPHCVSAIHADIVNRYPLSWLAADRNNDIFPGVPGSFRGQAANLLPD